VQSFIRNLIKFGYGALAGAGAAAVGAMSGFAGGEGWQFDRVSKAWGIMSVLLLTVLLGVLAVTGYRTTFAPRMAEEDYERRASALPFVAGMALVLLAAFLFLSPGPTLPPE